MAINRIILPPSEWRKIPAPARGDRYVVSVDLGQSQDYTAICILRHSVVLPDRQTWTSDEKRQVHKQDFTEHFDVVWMERLRLGMSYVDQTAYIAEVLRRPPLPANTPLVIDQTGVGAPVGDILAKAGLKPYRVTIGSGNEAIRHGAYEHTVPKSLLIAGLEARSHTKELRIAEELTEAGPLKEELKDFQRHISEAGRVAFGARTGKHDDLVLAVAIALWFATSGRPISSSEPLNI